MRYAQCDDFLPSFFFFLLEYSHRNWRVVCCGGDFYSTVNLKRPIVSLQGEIIIVYSLR